MRSSQKGNRTSRFTRFVNRMQQTASPRPIRTYGIIFFLLVSIGLTATYLRNFHLQDRAETYHVKALNSKMSDSALAKLSKDSFSYLAMIDAGSSGCRAHVYRYGKLGAVDGPLYIIPQHDSKKVKPGLSSFATNPTDAGASLQGLIDFMKEQVPEDQWAYTPIWLKATAGMRLIDKAQSDAVLLSVRGFLGDSAKSPFMFRQSWARIISGNEEGGFGWIAFNYLKKVIGPKKVEGVLPYAVVEMGGASSQVSQIAPSKKEAEAIPAAYRFSFTIEGDEFDLYTHSYLGFGAEQAREALNKQLLTAAVTAVKTVDDPCLNTGFSRKAALARKEVYEGPSGDLDVIGASNTPQACSTALSTLFKTKAECTPPSILPISFNCVYQPAFLTDSKNFLVFENFFYTSSALSMGGAVVQKESEKDNSTAVVVSAYPLLTSPKSFLTAATEICETEWTKAQTTYPKDTQTKDVTLKLCFSSSYANVFLTKGLGLNDNKVLTVQKEVDGSEIEWALGAAYKEAADFLKRTNLRPT